MHSIRTTARTHVLLVAMLALVIAAFLFAPDARAQFYAETVTVTNSVPTTSTDTVPSSVIDATQADEFTLQIVGRLASGTDTDPVTYTIQRSVNRVNWATAFTIAATAAGTNWVTAMTNVTAQAYPYWRILQIQNANDAAWTNGVVLVGTKTHVRKYSP